MNTINTLTTLMGDHSRKGKLHNIEFTESNGLRMLSDYLNMSTESDPEIDNNNSGIYNALQEIHTVLNNKAEFNDVLEKFQKISDAFALRITQSYEQLKNIKNVVNKLVASSENLAKSRISEDPVLASLEQDTFTCTKLKPVQWKYLSNVNETMLEQKLLNKLGMEEIKPGSEKYVHGLMIAHLPFGSATKTADFTPLKLTKGKMRELIDKVAEAVGRAYNKAEVQNIFAHILHLDRVDCNKAIHSIENIANGSAASKMNSILRFAHSYNTVLDSISLESFDVAKSTLVGIKERVNAMREFIDLTTYFCTYYRNHIWRDSIVVPGMFVNTDNWDEFTSADKAAIKKDPTLAILQYKNKIYENSDVPVSGIATKSIIDRCDTIAQEAYATASANTVRCNQQKRAIYRDAFIATAGKWLRAQKEFSREYSHTVPEEFAASVFDSNRDDAVENMFYTVILNSCFINTLTSKIHGRLRDEYKKAMASATQLTEKDLTNIDTKVMADVLNEFMVDLLLK